MFYCAPCQIEKDWPQSFSASRGPCEVCGKVRICFDVPSSELPEKKEEKSFDNRKC